jgi:hypothetical protein
VPVLAKVGTWQIQAARLRALMERRRATGEPVDEIAKAAQELLAEIEVDRQYLERQSSKLPPEVARHSRFQDVVRAVATASAAMTSVLEASGQDRNLASGL